MLPHNFQRFLILRKDDKNHFVVALFNRNKKLFDIRFRHAGSQEM
jgi:hypothetical protein